MEHIANILVGVSNAAVKSFKHDELEIFGLGKDHDNRFWHAIFRQAMIAGYIIKEIENYGLLKITEKGQEFLDNPGSFIMTKNHDYEAAAEEASAPAGGDSGDPVLFSMLKDLRKKIAKHLDLPSFVIFQDPSLADMSIQYPITMQEMQNIQGVGQGKASRYGKEFIELISNYVEENEIERPQDMVVKSIAQKSKSKVTIIQNIDRKLSLEDIALAKSITISELLTEIERIVSAGTKLDLNYYVNEYVDPYHQEEIYEYFREAESDSIENAIEELGEDEFTEEEVRLMRIKFMSDLGN